MRCNITKSISWLFSGTFKILEIPVFLWKIRSSIFPSLNHAFWVYLWCHKQFCCQTCQVLNELNRTCIPISFRKHSDSICFLLHFHMMLKEITFRSESLKLPSGRFTIYSLVLSSLKNLRKSAEIRVTMV